MSDQTRLYLVTPPVADPAAFRPLLDAALSAGDVACLHLRIAVAEPQMVKRFVQALAPAAQDRSAAVLIDPRLTGARSPGSALMASIAPTPPISKPPSKP